MTEMDPSLLSDLEAVVAAVPGVAAVYPARPTASVLADAARRLVTTRTVKALPGVVIDDGVARVTIGVSDGSATKAVVGAVHDALLAACENAGVPIDAVVVRIARFA